MYSTDNIAVAAGLKILGHKIKSIEFQQRHGVFFFESGSEDAYKVLNGIHKFSAITIHGEIRALSGLLRSMIGNKE